MTDYSLFGYRLNTPFGIPSSPLTSDSVELASWVTHPDLSVFTYKTVCSQERSGYVEPTLGFVSGYHSLDYVVHFARHGTIPQDGYIKGSLSCAYNAHSVVNSIGLPSLSPRDWQEDFLKSAALLSDGQLLILSVGAITNLDMSEDEIVAEYLETAKLAAQVTQGPLEINLSCPNTGGGLIYMNVPLSTRICKTIRDLYPHNHIIAKIGYLTASIVPDYIREIKGSVDGIAAINTSAQPVVNADESIPVNDEESANPYLFPGRTVAGLSGNLIRGLANETLQTILRLKEERQHGLRILAMGGVSNTDEGNRYLSMGADVVQSASRYLLDLHRKPALSCSLGNIQLPFRLG